MGNIEVPAEKTIDECSALFAVCHSLILAPCALILVPCILNPCLITIDMLESWTTKRCICQVTDRLVLGLKDRVKQDRYLT